MDRWLRRGPPQPGEPANPFLVLDDSDDSETYTPLDEQGYGGDYDDDDDDDDDDPMVYAIDDDGDYDDYDEDESSDTHAEFFLRPELYRQEPNEPQVMGAADEDAPLEFAPVASLVGSSSSDPVDFSSWRDRAQHILPFLRSKTWRTYWCSQMLPFDQDKESEYSDELYRTLDALILKKQRTPGQTGQGPDQAIVLDDEEQPPHEEAQHMNQLLGNIEQCAIYQAGANEWLPDYRQGISRAIIIWIPMATRRLLTSDANQLYPLVLANGPPTVVDAAMTWWQRYFDCRISPRPWKSWELSSLVDRWADIIVRYNPVLPEQRPLELALQPPPQVTGINTITLTLPIKQLQTLWKRQYEMQLLTIRKAIRKDKSDESIEKMFTYDVVPVLSEHIRRHYHIVLSAFTLAHIGIGAARVDVCGRIKIPSAPLDGILLYTIDAMTRMAAIERM
ncbi:kinetochore complex Sim4 subunit Fta1-domain-containing protein [Thamnocephalis sphaerospora]|uniref:Kinetochore complex Sim4 subunit Fta1-domain-containing protein n=1 Tax=Thamnocephalis sphaerospora TaxID=78915 RepID=A0A4P9XR21_9FUNG|nr:kinetochore complex Sim4 subunit Fta1-domain-containing protein [Thamnocephalis sphaerospora]|eukprot:RKP08505.1 kinetochore complex Sim4 subunit Fta1-domain-containing protein [Thamnocephalis sphaerospora]